MLEKGLFQIRRESNEIVLVVKEEFNAKTKGDIGQRSPCCDVTAHVFSQTRLSLARNQFTFGKRTLSYKQLLTLDCGDVNRT